MTDFSHLHELEERAVRIQERMSACRNNDTQWKAQAVQLFQTEQEIADEREFLGLEDMDVDDLYAAFFDEQESNVVREITKTANEAEQTAAIRIGPSGRNHGASFMRALHERAMLDPDAPNAIGFTSNAASRYLRMEPMQCTRNVVTEPDNFIFLPTGHFLGEISGLTGYWDGRRNKNNAPIVTFPEGEVSLSSEFVTMYEPTEKEIDIAISERKESGKGEYDKGHENSEEEENE